MAAVDSAPSPFRELRLAPEYRRCGWYLVASVPIVLATMIVVAKEVHPGRDVDWLRMAAVGAVFFTPSIGLLVVLERWRLRVDDLGLARRRLRSWDTWRWDEFADGEIERRRGNYFSKRRPWHRQVLTFEYLDKKTRDLLDELCRRRSGETHDRASVLPDGDVTLRYQWLYRLTLTKAGIEGRAQRGKFNYVWSDIEVVRMVVHDHDSPEILRLEVELPQKSPKKPLIVEGVYSVMMPPFDPSLESRPLLASEMEPALRNRVPADRFERHAIHGPPQTLSECDHRIGETRKKLKTATWLLRTIPAGLLAISAPFWGWKMVGGFAAGVLLNGMWLAIVIAITLLMVVVYPLICWALITEKIRRLREQLDMLEAWKVCTNESSHHDSSPNVIAPNILSL